MASKVNMKFVVGLSLALGAVFAGVAGAAWVLLKHSASDLMKLGDKKYAEGDFAKAAEFYAKGVFKDKANLSYLDKWEEALVKTQPQTPPSYDKAFMELFSLRRQRAYLRKTDVAAHKANLDLQWESISLEGSSKRELEQFVTRSEEVLKFFRDAGGESQAKGEALRRYRGAALARLMIQDPTLASDKVSLAQQDLEAALALDPKDELAAEHLMVLFETQADRARKDQKQDLAKAGDAKARKVIDDFLAADPSSPRMLMHRMRSEVDAQGAAIPAELADDEKRKRLSAIATAAVPRLDELAEACRKAGAERMDPSLLRRVQAIEQALDPTAKASRTESILTRALEAKPSDPSLLMLMAEVLASRQDFDGAIARATTVVELPRPTVSPEGRTLMRLKTEALFNRARWAVSLFDPAKPASEQAPVMARAKQYRDEFAKVVDPAVPSLKYLNAQVAFAEGDLAEASRLIASVNAESGGMRTLDSLWLDAQVAVRQNRPGDARERLNDILGAQPNSLSALLLMAEVERATGNLDRAEGIYTHILQRVDTGNARAKEGLALLEGIRTGKGTTSDPILNELLALKPLSEDPTKRAEMLKRLREMAAKHNFEPRVAIVLASELLRQGKRPEAVEVARQALAAHPDSADLANLKIGLEIEDPYEAQVAMVKAQKLAALEESLQLYSLAKTYRKDADAKAALEVATKSGAEDERVVEIRFLEALQDKKLDEASRLADQASRINSDHMEGASFRARLLQAQGRTSDAIETLRAALARGTAQPEAYRLLGRLQADGGRMGDAIASFERAVSARETDVGANKDLVGALIAAGRYDDALQRARKARPFAVSDEGFLAQWLGLEAQFGDPAQALGVREQMMAATPKDRTNKLAVAALRTQLKKYEEARPLIEDLKKEKDDLDAARVEAAWHDAQGNVAGAKKVFEDFIGRGGAGATGAQASIVLAQYLGEKGDVDGMIATLEKARAKQDPKTAEVDRTLAEVLLRLRRDEAGIEAARRVIASELDAQAKQTFRIGIAEALIRTRKPAEAEKELAALGDAQGKDYRVALLKADARRAQGDEAGARQILDEAVARFPDTALVYVRRAQLLMEKPSLQRDAKADLDKAVSLDKGSAFILRIRAQLQLRMDKKEEALADLKQAVALAPQQADLRQVVIGTLLAENRDDEATTVADQIVSASKNDPAITREMGLSFGQAGKWAKATRYIADAYKAERNAFNAGLYINSLLNLKPPNIADADKVLAEQQQNLASSVGLQMARSRVLWAKGRPADSKQAATEALKMVDPKNFTQLMAWYDALSTNITDNKEMVTYLEQTAKSGLAPDGMEFFRACVLFNDQTTRARGLEALGVLSAEKTTPQVRLAAFRQHSNALMSMGEFAESVRVMAKAVEAFPTDASLNNNLAYVLAKNLDKAGEALPYAQKANEASPNQSELLDTLGFVLKKLGKHQEAREKFDLAVLGAQSPTAKITALTHLAEVCLLLKDRPGAKRAYDQGLAVVTESRAQINAETLKEFEALKSQVE